MRAKTYLFLTTTLTLIVLLAACSSGPSAPEKGTPAFYWNAAKETYAAADYNKTLEHLGNLLKTDNEFKAQALPWSMTLTSGLIHGYMELADTYETGARANKTNPGAFRRLTSNYRTFAKRLSLEYASDVQTFQKTSATEVPLSFPFPNGNRALPPTMSRIASGIMPPESEVEANQNQVLQRNVMLQTALASGCGDDTTKAQSLFKTADLKVPRAEFMTAAAESLHDQALLYGPTKLDEPEKMKMLLAEARDSLKNVPENKAVKELTGKLDKAEKATAKKGKA
jgi:hypothetical protein